MPTRFYLPSTGASAVSPTFHAGWDVDGQAGARRAAVRTRINSAMTSVNIVEEIGSGTPRYLMRQYVTEPLPAQTISGTFKGQVRVAADASSWTQVSLSVRAVSNDGSTFAGSDLIALSEYVTGNAFAGTLTNRKMGDGDGVSNVFAINANDRLVIEIGVRSTAAEFESTVDMNFGDDSGTDLAEDETDTDADNPWIEFSQGLFDVTLTPSAVNGAGACPTPTIVSVVTLTPDAVNGLGEAGTPGWDHMAFPAVEGIGAVEQSSDFAIIVSVYNPDDDTSLITDATGTPGDKIYPTSPSSLYDGSVLSGDGVATFSGPGSGDSLIYGTNIVGAEGGSGGISYVIIYAHVMTDDTVIGSYVPHTAPQFYIKESGPEATYGLISGEIPSTAGGTSFWVSDHITVSPTSQPWTWADLEDLQRMGITAHWTLGIGESSSLLLQEIWMEVYGPQGTFIPPIAFRARAGNIIFNAAMEG